jgi:Fe-S-cluster containining protein
MRLPIISTDEITGLRRLHAAVDTLAAPLVAQHAARLLCRRGCSACCVDGLTVFAVEAAGIVSRHPELLANGTPHPEGACAFLDAEGACRIYADRPYVCRTQGLPLRWLEEREGQVVELRDICELNSEGPPITELSVEQCFTLGPIEERLRDLARAAGAGQRIALRALFGRK